MNNFFSKVIKTRKEYRIGSRPIDSVAGPSSGKRPDTRYPPMRSAENDMQDIQSIVGDFEQAYSSPQRINDSPRRGGNFVKRMVAALERKYNQRRDSRRNTPQFQRNCIVANDEFQIKHTPMNKTFVIKPRCRSVDRISNSPEGFPFFADEDNYIVDLTFEADEKQVKEKKKTPPKRNDKVMEKVGKSSAESCKKSGSQIKRERAPQIVGAFLKKPIEVEETEIDWIPITNQKLPRKSSFQKLVSLLTGKKSTNKCHKFYCDENKTSERIPEHRDSGYDEKNSSESSSQSSKNSNNGKNVHHHHHHQRKTPSQPKTAPVSSFKLPSEVSVYTPKKETQPTMENLARKLMLNEAARSEVRLSLGPFFPTTSKVDKFVSQVSPLEESEDEIHTYEQMDRSLLLPSIPKHPFVTPIPKHPFISEHSMSRDYQDSIMSIEEFRQIDMRQMLYQKYSSSKLICDVPKSSISTSSPDICLNDDPSVSYFKFQNDDIYDVPPVRIVRRKSCIFEDALSLKRRTAYLESFPASGSNFYASSDVNQFATVKSRNNKILPSQELLRSMADDECNQLRSPYLVNRLSHFNVVF